MACNNIYIWRHLIFNMFFVVPGVPYMACLYFYSEKIRNIFTGLTSKLLLEVTVNEDV